MSKNYLKNIVKEPKDPPGLIWIDTQFDVMRTMPCNECGNPISADSFYKCNRCKLEHHFQLRTKKYEKTRL